MSKLSLWRTIYLVCVFIALAVNDSAAETFTTIASFNGIDGYGPSGTLVQSFDGNLYGTTSAGGASSACSGGCGTVFKITAGGKLTTLYSFCSQTGCTDGSGPSAGLVQAANGNFYGTTFSGGIQTTDCYELEGGGCGMVFEITPRGRLITLYNFCSQANCTDGREPIARLVQTTDGNFYGTTFGGGADDGGTVFKITAGGKLTTLHRFNSADGVEPEAGLVQAANGNFYGTMSAGGTYLYYGTVFEITAGGRLTTLYSFCSKVGCPDGRSPVAELAQATNGNFYGTTEAGGATDHGTVFEITPRGQLTTLYSFCSKANCTDGITPYAGLAQATNGNFYGTTFGGGAHNKGTVFSLTVGLRPFVETLPNSGKVGATVIILGNHLTGATSITFNGKAAKFRVVSSTEITTTVPCGATTGPVKVTTPNRTLTSNVNFRVS